MATVTATSGKKSTKVLVGTADIWLAPTGTPNPALPTTGLLVPTTPWYTTGQTLDGVVLNYGKKVSDIRTETQITPVDKTVTSATLSVDLTLAQDTLLSMKLAYGGGTLSRTAASVTKPGFTKLALSNALDKFALLLIGKNVEGFDRIIYIPKVVSVGKVKTSFLRSKTQRAYPATFDALCTLETVAIVNITAAAT